MIKTLLRVWRALRSPAPHAEQAPLAEDAPEPAWSEPDEPLVVPLEDVIDLHPFAPQEIRSVVE